MIFHNAESTQAGTHDLTEVSVVSPLNQKWLAGKIPSNYCEKAAVMSETMKKLNDNNVTEVTFLGGRVAVIFSFSSGH